MKVVSVGCAFWSDLHFAWTCSLLGFARSLVSLRNPPASSPGFEKRQRHRSLRPGSGITPLRPGSRAHEHGSYGRDHLVPKRGIDFSRELSCRCSDPRPQVDHLWVGEGNPASTPTRSLKTQGDGCETPSLAVLKGNQKEQKSGCPHKKVGALTKQQTCMLCFLIF